MYGGILKTKNKKQQVEKKKGGRKEEDNIMKNRRKRRNNGTNEKRRTIPFSWPSHEDSSRPAQIKNPLGQNAIWRKGARPIKRL